MATVSVIRNKTLPDSSQKQDFYDLIDLTQITISQIVNADIASSAAIADSKLAQLTTASKVALSAIAQGGATTDQALVWNGSAWAPTTLNSVPTATISMYGASSAPTGWLLCDGSAVSRTTYAALFAIISTTYGTGDGSTTFNVPDMRSRTPIGLGQGSGLTNRSLNDAVGTETHTLVESEMPAHTHSYTRHGAGGASPGNAYASGTANADGSDTTGSTGGGGAHQNMQPSRCVNFIIKT